MNVLSALQGVSIPLPQMVQQLESIGWTLGRIQFKDNQFLAPATNQMGEEIVKTGPSAEMAVANTLLAAGRRNHIRSFAMFKVGMWQGDWIDRLKDIAEDYRKAPIYDPKAVAAYKALGDDSVHRLNMLRRHLVIEPTNDPTPYKSAEDLRKDIHDKRHYLQSMHGLQHPVWTPEQHAAFRAVHHILGHGVAGGEFGWHGANAAMAAHAPIVPGLAQQALFSEAVARPAFIQIHGPGPHKIALFPDYLEGLTSDNHPGIHPSQTPPPVAMPSVTAGADATLDVNHGWNSGIDPLPTNAYLHHGDPMQAQEVMNNASLIDTGWSKMDRAQAKQAIVNAFRVVLLSPRKDLRWNAIHYQDIANVPADVTDPKVYWDTLENKRREWNSAQGIDPEAHMIYYPFLKPFESLIYAQHPELGREAATEKAKQTLFNWWTEEQQRIEAEDAKKPADKQRTADEIERRANEALARRLKEFLKPSNEKTDFGDGQISMFGALQERFAKMDWSEEHTAAGGQYNLLTGQEGLKYGAFMGTHLKAISQVSQHADEILDAALEDIRDHDATGHHFRAKVLSLGVSGVGPKVCSFAWLLLQPMTSQLATIDTHMMDVLGHNYEKEMNNRDYFKFERELAAGRDAAGYGHVPLGSFQWGMWDYKRTGPGSHQDHSAMAVLNPKPHQQIDWVGKAQNLKGEQWLNQAPDWWQNTQAARDQVGQEWNNTYGKNFPSNSIPYQTVDESHLSKTASRPSKMARLIQQTGLTVPEIWDLGKSHPVLDAT